MNDCLKASLVDVCTDRDVGQVADLHCKTFYRDGSVATPGLRAYYREVFFNNPWVDKSFPSFVYRSAAGQVVGFMGCIPRHMTFGRRPLRVAVAHRLMVDPGGRFPFAASSLVRAFFSGSQDLSISDGANEVARRLWEAAGGSTSFVHSLDWLWPLRPSRYVTQRYLGAKGWLASASRPLCAVLDPMLKEFWGRRLPDSTAITVEEVSDDATILSCLRSGAEQRDVRPAYEPGCLHWLLDQLRKNRDRGRLHCVAIRDKENVRQGICLYYLRSDMQAEILLLAVRKCFTASAIGGLMRFLRRGGVVAVRGRIDPEQLGLLSENGCYLKLGSWALVHSTNAGLLHSVRKGDIFLSSLEGELWLRSPHDRL